MACGRTTQSLGLRLSLARRSKIAVAVAFFLALAAPAVAAAPSAPAPGKTTQSVTVHAMAAGEKFFIDLLPATWSGLPPGLPQDVVDELARRAREAETLL